MKKIRGLVVSVAAMLMFLGLAATGIKAQSLFSSHFAGEFTLPFMAQWGSVILPPGDYNLYYGRLSNTGAQIVEVRGQGMLPHGLIIVNGRNDVKGTENRLVCVLEGNKAYVRGLELPAIGESAEFLRPKGARVESWIVAEKQGAKGTAQPAETRVSVLSVPIKLSAK